MIDETPMPNVKPRECPTIKAIKEAMKSEHFKTERNMRNRMFYLLGWLGRDTTHDPTVQIIRQLLMEHQE